MSEMESGTGCLLFVEIRLLSWPREGTPAQFRFWDTPSEKEIRAGVEFGVDRGVVIVGLWWSGKAVVVGLWQQDCWIKFGVFAL